MTLPHTNSDVGETLAGVAESLASVRFDPETVRRLEKLAASANDPCVVAVVGRVKAGKSTFVNALLGADLAKVGATETTATINRFVYGTAPPDRPVRCHWSNGQISEESGAFLDSLQGNDEETLRKAAGISYLEYRLPLPFLERVTLVDTPGMAAVVDEHQDRSAAFLGLRSELRDRNIAATEAFGSEADAVIYVIGEVARTTDQAFLEEFANVTGGKAQVRNAVGVVSKVDRQPEILQRRYALCDKIATQLKDSLNTVLPVAAALERQLGDWEQEGNAPLIRLTEAVMAIPSDTCDLLLSGDELWTTLEMPDCPVSPAERTELLGTMPWSTFATIVHEILQANGDLSRTVSALREMAGFGPLRDLLHRRFLERGQLLRSYRVLSEARALIGNLRYRLLPAQKKQDRAIRDRFARLLTFVHNTPETGDSARSDLLALLEQELQGAMERSTKSEAVLRDAERCLALLQEVLQQAHTDQDSLEMLDQAFRENAVSAAELEELRSLFGLYGTDIYARLRVDTETDAATMSRFAEQRARTWNVAAPIAHAALRQTLCRRAAGRFEILLADVLDTSAND